MYVTIAAIFEVGPNDVFLGEAEHAEPASTHGGVYGDPRVSHQLGAFIKLHPADNTARAGLKPRLGEVPVIRPRGSHFLSTCIFALFVSYSTFRRPGLCSRCCVPLSLRDWKLHEVREHLSTPPLFRLSKGLA